MTQLSLEETQITAEYTAQFRAFAHLLLQDARLPLARRVALLLSICCEQLRPYARGIGLWASALFRQLGREAHEHYVTTETDTTIYQEQGAL